MSELYDTLQDDFAKGNKIVVEDFTGEKREYTYETHDEFIDGMFDIFKTAFIAFSVHSIMGASDDTPRTCFKSFKVEF